jgi:hypothetical protein
MNDGAWLEDKLSWERTCRAWCSVRAARENKRERQACALRKAAHQKDFAAESANERPINPMRPHPSRAGDSHPSMD